MLCHACPLDDHAYARCLPHDAEFSRDRFGSYNNTPPDETNTTLIFAGEHKDRIALSNIFCRHTSSSATRRQIFSPSRPALKL
ncbi:protein of unknown function [Hyphomicrobium sp. MC1]|nr:protein of unknown function [Hyphomicrobium sp. MC1]